MLNTRDKLQVACECGNTSDFKYMGVQWIPLTPKSKLNFKHNHYHDILKNRYGYKIWYCNLCHTSLVSGKDNKAIL